MNRFTGVVLGVLVLGGCSDSTTEPLDDGAREGTPGVSILTGGDIEYGRDTIDVQNEGEASASTGFTGSSFPVAVEGGDGEEYTIVQVARIPALTLASGDVVQANDIVVDQTGGTAYIAYNTQGAPWRGAIAAYDITNKDEPQFLGGLGIEWADVNAVYVRGDDIFVAGAVDPEAEIFDGGFEPGLSFVAHLDRRTWVDNPIFDPIRLPAFAATGVTELRNEIYVSTGAEGGRIVQLTPDLEVLAEIDAPDARDVVSTRNGILALQGGNGTPNGHIIVSGADFNGIVTSDVPGMETAGLFHKASIEVWDGTVALMGLSQLGWGAVDYRNPGNFLDVEPNPETPECDEELICVTNSVTTDGNLIFTANGEYGFRIFRPRNKNQLDGDFVKVGFYDCADEVCRDGVPAELRSEKYSANHVELKAGYLFVASGAYGTFVYSLD